MAPPAGDVPDDSSDRHWLVEDHGPRRLVRSLVDRTGRPWTADTRVVAYDAAALTALATRAKTDGLDITVMHTRRGVPYLILPGDWILAVSVEEAWRWGVAVASWSYLARVIVARHWQIATHGPEVPSASPPDPLPQADDVPPELGEEYRQWSL